MDNIDKKYKIFYIPKKTYGEKIQRTQYQKIPKGSEKIYICDGGILTCPNIGKILLNSKYLIKEKNEKNIYTCNEFVFNIRVW